MAYSAATGEERYALYAASKRLSIGTQDAAEDFAGSGVSNDADVETLITELQAAIDAVNAAA